MKTTEVLLIGPNTKSSITDTRWVTAPLGVHYLASYLQKEGIFCKIYDMNIDTTPLETIVQERQWDIIGFSILEATIEYDIAKIHLVKKLAPQSILVAGGTGATLNYQIIFNKSPLDIVIQAEGEIPLLNLCTMIQKFEYANAPIHTIPGIIIRTYASQLTNDQYWQIRKDLNIPQTRALEYWEKTSKLYEEPNFSEINTFRLYTSNYCPMDCAFCTLSRLRKYACGKNYKVLALSVDQIMELVYKVVYTYPSVKQIFFVDDDFLLIKQRGIDFCKRVILDKKDGKLPKELTFLCLTNINRISESNIGLLKDAGFRVLSIGVESTSQHVLDSLDKKQQVETIWKTTKLILKYEIKPYYTLILFAPDSTIEDLVTDLEGFRTLGSMGVGLSIEPYFIPLKGTRFSEEHYPERTRKVSIENTNEFLYKSFAWVPKESRVYKLFEQFEEIYPKYRKFVFETSKTKHKEKNFQAYIILDALEYILWKAGIVHTTNNLHTHIDQVNAIKHLEIDVVGGFNE